MQSDKYKHSHSYYVHTLVLSGKILQNSQTFGTRKASMVQIAMNYIDATREKRSLEIEVMHTQIKSILSKVTTQIPIYSQTRIIPDYFLTNPPIVTGTENGSG